MVKKSDKKPAKKPAGKTAPAVKKAAAKKPLPAKGRKPAAKSKKPAVQSKPQDLQEWLRDKVVAALEDGKAEHIVCVDVRGQSPLTDFLIIASGRSSRQVKALGEAVQKALESNGVKRVRLEGTHAGDWVVVDGGDMIAHIFRPEVRAFYRLEEVWGLEPPLAQTFKDL